MASGQKSRANAVLLSSKVSFRSDNQAAQAILILAIVLPVVMPGQYAAQMVAAAGMISTACLEAAVLLGKHVALILATSVLIQASIFVPTEMAVVVSNAT
jgi:hypothetical protein